MAEIGAIPPFRLRVSSERETCSSCNNPGASPLLDVAPCNLSCSTSVFLLQVVHSRIPLSHFQVEPQTRDIAFTDALRVLAALGIYLRVLILQSNTSLVWKSPQCI